MQVGRVVGVFLLRLVDALVPAVVFAAFGFFLVTDLPLEFVDPVTAALSLGSAVFLVTIVFGLLRYVYRDDSFPATRAVRQLFAWYARFAPW